MINFKIERVLADLSGTGDNVKRLTVTKWGDYPGKLDIRKWKIPERDGDPIPSKGVTLTDEEAELLLQALTEYFRENE